MRDYAKIPPQFWINSMGKKIRALGLEAQLIAVYLMSNPHATMLGIYYLPIQFIAHELNIPFEGALKGLQSLCEMNFCTYDTASEYIWVHEMVLSQVGDQLKPSDNRVKSINETYQNLPELSFLKDFFNKYQTTLQLESTRENSKNISPFEGALEVLRSQEQEQEQEQEQYLKKEKQAKEKNFTDTKNLIEKNCDENFKHENSKLITQIFQFWQTTLNHPQAKLDKKRKACIRQALTLGFSVEQLQDAIVGCSLTPHNLGHNERGERYDGLHVIFKNADNIERFIRNCHNPPHSSATFSATKNNFPLVNKTRLTDDNFDNKQYTQTPLKDISWLKS